MTDNNEYDPTPTGWARKTKQPALNRTDAAYVGLLNEWGSTGSWQGRIMYVSPEQLARYKTADWRLLIQAISACKADVLNDPESYGTNEPSNLDDYFNWAMKKYIECVTEITALRQFD